jgi:hypothetical protein
MNLTIFRSIILAISFLFPITCLCQAPLPFWSNMGNSVGSGDFLGTTNNMPMIIRTNNVERFRIGPNGFVGIGTNNPQYLLDVNGNVHFNGTVTAMGINIVNKIQADTVRGVSMIDVNGTLGLTGGLYNEVFARTGELRIQSNSAYSGNVIMGANNMARIGIGISSPLYKLDVNGDARFTGIMRVYRITALPGDSLIRFGDSTMVFATSTNRIFSTSSNSSNYQGIGIGSPSATGGGKNSLAFGSYIAAAGIQSIALGSGVNSSTTLTNSTPNSLMIGFNSTVPTFFVGPGNGVNTFGKVGIRTSNPLADFQVGEGIGTVAIGDAPLIGSTFSNSYMGFNAARSGPNQWVFQNNGAANGGVVMLGTVGGGFRIIGVQSSGGANQTLTDQQLQLWTRFEIQPSGRVLIGVPDPATGSADILANSIYNTSETMLTVRGRIMCQDLVVSKSADWPDYVFDSTYTLMSIDSMGQYVSYYHHLPGSASASAQASNGISLAETCRSQQEQIEVLTLYILELNARLKAIEAQQAVTNTNGGK